MGGFAAGRFDLLGRGLFGRSLGASMTAKDEPSIFLQVGDDLEEVGDGGVSPGAEHLHEGL